MKKISAFIERLQDILDAMDELNEDGMLDEINAEFEDTIFLMENIDPDDADAQEEFEGALEEIEDILAEYRDFEDKLPIGQKLIELDTITQTAKKNLP